MDTSLLTEIGVFIALQFSLYYSIKKTLNRFNPNEIFYITNTTILLGYAILYFYFQSWVRGYGIIITIIYTLLFFRNAYPLITRFLKNYDSKSEKTVMDAVSFLLIENGKDRENLEASKLNRDITILMVLNGIVGIAYISVFVYYIIK